MKDLLIKKTRVTPEVHFERNGVLMLEGVTLPEDAAKFYKELINYIEDLYCDNIHFTVKLEYINTASAKQIFLIFRELEKKSKQCDIKIDWTYPEDDEDIYDSGKHYASLMKELDFSFVSYADA